MTNNNCTIYIARHGETDWNKKRLMQGQTDVDLNSEGEEQARRLGEKLKDIHFHKVFSSDLLRAKRTAEIAVLEKKLAVETTEKLRERLFGRLEGKSVETWFEIESLAAALQGEEREQHYEKHEIERQDVLVSRVVTFLRETAVAYPGKTILMVTHGGIIRTLVHHLGLVGKERFSVENTAYIKLETDGVDFFVKETNGITGLTL